MSWRDRYQPGGKFREATFWVDSSDLSFGRRNQVHEFPLKDKAVVEDLGRKARTFTFRAFVIGDNYDIERNNLIAEIEKPGSGWLIHPWLGVMIVSITDARESENSQRMGMAEFTITCVEAGDLQFIFEQPDTATAVEVAADKSIADSIAEFGDNFSVLQQAADYITEIQGTMGDILGAVENVVDGITGPITELIRAPGEMAATIANTLGNLENSLESPARALDIYKTLFKPSSPSASIPNTTSNRQQQIANVDAVASLVTRIAIAEACRTVAGITWPTLDDAINVRDQIITAIENEMHQAMGDAVFDSMSALRTALAEDTRVRGAKLPRLSYYTPATDLPALVLAHQLYGDITRSDELIARSNIRHPGFVPGGSALEILADV
jgi:prophage DNA circulation protein